MIVGPHQQPAGAHRSPARSCTPASSALVIEPAASAPGRAGSSRFDGVDRPRRRRGAAGLAPPRRRARRPTTATSCWVHELVGRRGARPVGPGARAGGRGGGEPGARPARAGRRRRSCRSCSWSAATGGGRRRPARRAARREPLSGRTVRIDVFTIFPEYLEGPLGRVAARAGPGTAGLLDVRLHDPRDWTDRPPPQRRRHPVRRRRGHGDGAGAAVRGGRGGRPAPAAVPARAARAPLRPGRGPRAGRR